MNPAKLKMPTASELPVSWYTKMEPATACSQVPRFETNPPPQYTAYAGWRKGPSRAAIPVRAGGAPSSAMRSRSDRRRRGLSFVSSHSRMLDNRRQNAYILRVSTDSIQRPGTLLVNGRIYPDADAAEPVASLAIDGGLVVAAGTREEAAAALPPGARTVDLRGRTVLPAFIESHTHFHRSAVLSRFFLDFETLRPGTVDDVLAAVSKRASEVPLDAWIQGDGLSPARLAEGRLPDRHELDRAGGGRADRAARHRQARRGRQQRGARGGRDRRLDRGPAGRPDRARRGRDAHRDPPRARQAAPGPVRAGHRRPVAGRGGTPRRAAGRGPRPAPPRHRHAPRDDPAPGRGGGLDGAPPGRRAGRAGPPVLPRPRVAAGPRLARGAGHPARPRRRPARGPGHQALGRTGSASSATRSSTSRTRASRRTCGLLRIDDGRLRELVARANAQGLQVAVHAVGARAVDMALDAFEAAGPGELRPVPPGARLRRRGPGAARPDPRPRRHLVHRSPRSGPPMPASGPTRSAPSDGTGSCRSPEADALGIPMLFNSDAPCAPVDPLGGIRAAVSGGDTPAGAVSRRAAWRAFTSAPADAAGEPRLGRLVPGSPGRPRGLRR